MIQDCVQVMFEELRASLPPLPSLGRDADAIGNWVADMRQIIRAMPTDEQRWSCTEQLANDLVSLRYPGMPFAMAYDWLAKQFGLKEMV